MGLPAFIRDFASLYRQSRHEGQLFRWGMISPWLDDRVHKSGVASGHYFHQDLHVAKKIFQQNPQLHVDVGSRVDGFVAHVATFREIEIFDIRPQNVQVGNIKFRQVDFMSDVGYELKDYCDSLSCLHALEHFGLGRYGDPVDYYGYMKGLDNLCDILKQGGRLYLSVPMGSQRIEYNGHRVFSLKYLLELLDTRFAVDGFSYVDDAGEFHADVDPAMNTDNNFDCEYGCAIFELIKK